MQCFRTTHQTRLCNVRHCDETLANSILFTTFRFDDLKIGKLVGTDKYGNKYYENNYYFYGRNRWVEYAPHVHMAYDASQIPAEWYGWMHYKVNANKTNVQIDSKVIFNSTSCCF